MSATASTSKPAESTNKVVEQKQDTHPHLGVLEEDDEFEEFEVELNLPCMDMIHLSNALALFNRPITWT